ncbi:MAG: uracil-DNA glycosylase [Chloroflexia bacterium]|nr:uracil-DNA glycosylase [Chloroflexia bacterium]
MSVLAEINREILVCKKCRLHESRTQAVPGEGPSDAKIMFIGEGPGFYEDQQGRPFVGPSGHLLEKLLASIGLAREQVFIANVIKCRPPNNRDPLPSEIETCRPYLDRQIEAIDPRIIATLGRFSMERYFPGARITKIHGRARREGRRVYLPLYHPAYVLRNQRAMGELEKDLGKIPRLLARLEEVLADEALQGTPPAPPPTEPSAPEAPEAEAPKQLRLF